MPTQPFSFAVTLSDEKGFDEMLADLAACVLGHVGFAPDTIVEMLGAVHDALGRGTATGLRQCETRFFADAGQLVIVVAYAGAEAWRTTRPLP